MRLRVLNDVAAGPAIHQFGYETGLELGLEQFAAEVGNVNAAIQFRSRNTQLQLFRLTQTVIPGRGKTHHWFTKTHEIIFCHCSLSPFS